MKMQDISSETFGKYQYCTGYLNYMWSDEDFMLGGGSDPLKWFAKSSPSFFVENTKRIRYIPIVSEIMSLFRLI